MNLTLERLEDIKKNGYQLDFGNAFNHAFENYKKIALYAGLMLFVFLILFSVVIAGSLISALGITAMTHEFSPEKFRLENLSETNLLIFEGISLIMTCLLSPVDAGFLKMANCADKDEEFHVSTIFSYYKFRYLKEIISATFLITFISLFQSTVLAHFGIEILGGFISYFLLFITYFTIPLIIFGNLSAIDAITHSIQIVLKQPFVLLGLIIVAFIGAMVGIMACCIGLFFTIPFFYSMKYAIYSAIVGIDEPNENK
jgi:hypothetical protein